MYPIIPDPNLQVQPQQSKFPAPLSPHCRSFVFPLRRFLLTCAAPLNPRLCVLPLRPNGLVRLTSCSSLSSAQPDLLLRLLSTEGRLVPDPCTTPASICVYHKVWFHWFIYLIAAESSRRRAEEPNVHTHPPSRGGEEEEVSRRQPDATVKLGNMNYSGEIMLTRTSIFILYLTFNFNLPVTKVLQITF